MTRKVDLAIAVALAPIIGSGVVLIYQLARFLFYVVPAELLELDGYKILIRDVSTIFVGTAMLFAATTLYGPVGNKPAVRFLFHFAFAAAITALLWVRDVASERLFQFPRISSWRSLAWSSS